MNEVNAVVMEVFTRVIGEPPSQGAATTPADVNAWGSLAHVQLVFEIEQALGVRMPDGFLENRTTVGALIEAAEAAVSTA